MAMCNSCFGAGKRTCPSCLGRKTIWNIGMSEPMQCLVCDSGGKVRCDFCNGTGVIGDRATPTGIIQPPPPPDYPLVGIWNLSGGSWKITEGPTEYKVTETGALGRTGQGIARLTGDQVRVELRSILFFTIVYELRLDRENHTMSGTKLGFPIVVERA